MPKKILITGFSGFVSKHFCEYLENNKVKALIKGVDHHEPDFKYDNFEFLSFDFAKADLSFVEETERIIFDFKPDFILHLAAYSSVAYSWENPTLCFNNNINMFLNILEAIKKHNIETRVLSVGSSEEYGKIEKKFLPLKEATPLNPASPYAVARVAQEMLAKVYVNGYGMDIILTRSFNHFGPEQKDTFVVASFAKQLMMLKKNSASNGNLITGDISIVRDFTDVRDIVHAYYLLLQKGKKGEVYNVCSGKGVSLNEIISIMAEILDINIEISIDESLIRPGEIKEIIGSNEKIKKSLKWDTKYTLKQSLNDTLNYWDRLL